MLFRVVRLAVSVVHYLTEVTLSPIPLHLVKGCQSSAAQTDGVAPLWDDAETPRPRYRLDTPLCPKEGNIEAFKRNFSY